MHLVRLEDQVKFMYDLLLAPHDAELHVHFSRSTLVPPHDSGVTLYQVPPEMWRIYNGVPHGTRLTHSFLSKLSWTWGQPPAVIDTEPGKVHSIQQFLSSWETPQEILQMQIKTVFKIVSFFVLLCFVSAEDGRCTQFEFRSSAQQNDCFLQQRWSKLLELGCASQILCF